MTLISAHGCASVEAIARAGVASMGVTCHSTHPVKGLLWHRGPKRYLWILSLLAFTGIVGYYLLQQLDYALFIPLGIIYGALPFLNVLSCSGTNNPPRATAPVARRESPFSGAGLTCRAHALRGADSHRLVFGWLRSVRLGCAGRCVHRAPQQWVRQQRRPRDGPSQQRIRARARRTCSRSERCAVAVVISLPRKPHQRLQ